MKNYYQSSIQKGSSGDDVKKWQRYLNNMDYGLEVDGVFGDATLEATKDFQLSNGLKSDGIVGDESWGFAGFTKSPKSPSENGAPTVGGLPSAPRYDTTKWDDTAKGQSANAAYGAAKENLGKYEGYTYTDYTKGDDVLSAEQAYADHLEDRPGEYTSQWEAQIAALMNQIMGREQFSYDVGEDPLYQQYRDQYIRQGKIAMEDVMGQASAMTGGYTNSYAQSVGQQAYQASLAQLGEVVPDLYQMALDRYIREGQDLANQYGMLADRESLDYGRYRDSIADWETERNFLQNRLDSERNFDYGKHMDRESIKQQLKADEYNRMLEELGIARDDYYAGADLHYTDQSNKNSIAAQKFNDEMAIWGAQTDQEWQQAQWDRDEKRYQDNRNPTGGNGIQFLSDGSVDLSSIPGINTDDPTWFDEKGNFKIAEHVGNADSLGEKVVYRMDGKNITVPAGTSPYTKTKNPDTEKGTLPNGFQPDNIGGQKLKDTLYGDYINGVWETIWALPDGTEYIWDHTQNAYRKYED